MCGIVGYWSPQHPVQPGLFDRMRDTLGHRGPDGGASAFFEGNSVALGHRRLAIIDLSDAATQPIANEDGSVWAVHNGEIYNFKALREQLLERGHRFRSQGDSEVIVHAWEEWGPACVERMRGIFAIGLYDLRRRQLFLARDQLGVKPLFVLDRGHQLMFASEPRALLAHPDVSPTPHRDAFWEYLALGFTLSGGTIYEGMTSLRPATSLLIDDSGRRHTRTFWEVPDATATPMPFEALRRQTTDALVDAVKTQLVADVPTGLFLSGGVDSSVVGGIATRHHSSRMQALSIGFSDATVDESRFARRAAEAIDVELQLERFTLDDALGLLPDVVEQHDQPFADASSLPTLAVSALARQAGLKVVLTGDGGDEVFGGYERFDMIAAARSARLADRWRHTLPTISRALLAYRISRHLEPLPLPVRRALRPANAGQLTGQRHVFPFVPAGYPNREAVRRCELRTYLLDDILTKVDRASMWVGLEARVPLLDVPLVELAFACDQRWINHDGQRKYLMRQAAAGFAPPDVLSERKAGFGIPHDEWGTRSFRPMLRALWPDSALVEAGLVAAAGLEAAITEPGASSWIVLIAELWARRWLRGEDPRVVLAPHLPTRSLSEPFAFPRPIAAVGPEHRLFAERPSTRPPIGASSASA